MKNIFIFLLICVAGNTMFGQQVIISFQLDSAAYQSLEGATHLTEGFTEEDWNDDYPEFQLQENITIQADSGVIVYDYVELIPDGEIYFWGMQVNGAEDAAMTIAPMSTILKPRIASGSDSINSEIHYLYEDGVSYFEYKNFSFGPEALLEVSPDNLFNFIVSVRHEDGQTCFHYGPSRYDPQVKGLFRGLFFVVGMGIILENEVDNEELFLLIQGNPQDPDIYFGEVANPTSIKNLDDIPAEGTLYKMTMSTPTFVRSQFKQLDGRLYPNPGRDDIQVEIGEGDDDQPFEIKVYDQLGRMVLSEQSNGGSRINVSGLASGNYLIQVLNKDGVFVTQWAKQ